MNMWDTVRGTSFADRVPKSLANIAEQLENKNSPTPVFFNEIASCRKTVPLAIDKRFIAAVFPEVDKDDQTVINLSNGACFVVKETYEDGYKFTDTRENAFARSYECTITPKETSAGKKVLKCTESSHDVPMGSTTYVIALTDREYTHLQNVSFRSVEDFVNRVSGNNMAASA